MITKLTPEQEAELPAFQAKYLDIACGGKRIDRDSLQSALNDAYAMIGKSAPALFIFDSPATCMLAVKIFKIPKESQLESQLQSQLQSQLWSQLQSQLESQLESQLWSQLQSQLRIQLWGQLRSQLWSQLESQLESQLRSQLRSQLWSQLRSQLWSQLESQLRSQNIYDGNYLLGSQDLYWLAFYRFCQSIGVNYGVASKALDTMEAISSQCEWWWPFDGVVIASEKPVLIKWDDEQRLHSENGPAVEYADGYVLHSWHGQAIPGDWVTGNPPKASDALHWSNMDQRAAACEIVGWHKILEELDAKVIDDSADPIWGRLVEVDLPDSGRERFLDAMCGTGRRFALPVPPKTKTVDEAQSVLHGGLPVEILKNFEVRT